MKLKLFIILLFIFFLVKPIFSFKIDDISAQDAILQSSLLLLIYADCVHTHYYLNNDPSLYEQNPFLDKTPSGKDMALLGTGFFLIHTGVTVLLPSRFRPIWQSTFIGIEVHSLYKNIFLCTSKKF